MDFFAQPRTRSALFALGALVLLGLIGWVMLSRADSALPDSAPAPTLTGEVVPYAPPVPNQSMSDPAPSAPATDTPSSATTEPAAVPKWTDRDIIDYLTAYNTFNWQESEQVFIDRVIKAGAVPDSRAAAYPYPDVLLAGCQRRYCSTEFLSADRIEAGDRAQVKAKAKVRFTDYGKSQTQVLSCTLTLATGSDTKRGMFTDVFCLGPNG